MFAFIAEISYTDFVQQSFVRGGSMLLDFRETCIEMVIAQPSRMKLAHAIAFIIPNA